jgi:hypothetical protein
VNQNEREGQSTGRTTGASGEDAERQQERTIEGQESQPGKVWQESDRSQYTGQGDDGSAGDTSGGTGGMSSGGTPQGQYRNQADASVGGSDPRGGDKEELPENEQIDESQWQGNRFSQGGGIGNQGGSNG